MIERHKLTKKFFLGLPSGVYLVSNCYKKVAPNISTPIFHEYTEQPTKRISQWERIKTVGADQRLCDVYQSSEEFKKAVEYKTVAYGNYPKIVIFEVEEK